ncbi:nucleotidyltransferase domain-containing protein [Oceanobacillus bengalensis]|uniref:Nucleotidyltransferase domain-containing protein n=1 Tax=Oceanobacillus bengalensis TaxID=1435466 RepID=A0A494Z501_9BACI|nr:nucleotidyltransferase domain-containing protein [Oceanobacillus bengalensis]RKQ17612.1 nucleotidyltransferase domain-containing protein [Oceanobacillus bengalensis]
MKEKITNILKQIERDYSIKILHACDVGSRAWGLANNDSDYDVRFIYVHQTNHYLSIDPVGIGKKKDVIEIPIHDSLDISGWEITKALRLFRKSNPSLLERLYSTITYYEKFSTIKQLRKMVSDGFNAKPCMYHYLNMAKQNYQQILQSEDRNIKDYLNVLRPVLLACLIEKNNEFPPLDFNTLVDAFISKGKLRNDIDSLIKYKVTGDVHFQSTHIDSFLEKEITRLEQRVKTLHSNNAHISSDLNKLFQDTLLEVWG